MSKGTITRRGKSSWRLKFDLPRGSDGKRRIGYETIRGKRADAEAALRAILHRHDKGMAIEPTQVTVGEYVNAWLADVAPRSVAPKGLERYRGLAKFQIKPHLGTIRLQKLRPADIDTWVGTLERSGLSIRSIRHAHGCLRSALAHAAAVEIVERNVCKIIRPPKLERTEIEILTAEQVADALQRLDAHPFYPVVALALGTGCRRGELAALCWGDVNLDAATVRIERSAEQTKGQVRVKAPKTAAGRRTVSLPAFAVDALRNHRIATLELRMALGAGPLRKDAPVFATLEGEPLPPHLFTNRWRRAVKNRKLPRVSFHALRHTHASMLIAAGLDPVSVSKRLGHASPALTLGVYAHLFNTSDDKAAAAIDAALG